jgi:Ras-related GTP-binding protein C/D
VQESLGRLIEVVTRAHMIKPEIVFEVFIHKVDGDLFLSDEHKIDCHR